MKLYMNTECVCVCEWIGRENAIRLAEKEKREKEKLEEIIEEAEEFKIEFYRKRKVTVENNKSSNKEKEKVSCLIKS